MLNQGLKASLVVGLLASSGSLFAMEKANSQMQSVLDALANKKGKPIETLSPAEARMQPTPADAAKTVMEDKKLKAPPSTVTSEDIQIDGASGKIAARVYRPAARMANLPLVVYFHGGGFVIATNDTYDASPRSLSQMTNAIFLSVEYSKGPEHKFPAAQDDAFAAYQWALKNAKSLGADPQRIAVAGESAGGNLALNVAIKARDSGIQIPAHELLVYPLAGNDLNTASYKENANAKPLNKPMIEWFVKNYTSKPSDVNDTRMNLLAADVKGLKPATVITATIDPLRSEGKALADKMEKAGVKVNYKNFDGVTHEFFGMAAVLDAAKEAQRMAADDLTNSFKSTTFSTR